MIVFLFAILGLVFGSFLNVIIHRLPKEESIIYPPSQCPYCKTNIEWYHNIPVLSFIKLKGNLNEVDNYKFFESELFYILSSTPFVLSIAFIAFTAFIRNRKKSYSETIKNEEKRIYNMIDSAKKLTNEKNQFYDIIEKSIIKSLMVKFSIRMESLNKEKIQEITENKGLSNEHISQIINLIENCEKAKYSRSSDSVMNKDLENARKVVGIIMKTKS